ncbi:MAG: N-6 DNA methylase [Phycisphaerales bacterium]|nr:N-6 DNA methylase [Phycisphaerales bacterium]
MPTLEDIRTFDQLLHYLEEELDWPIPDMDWDEVEDLAFFNYSAEEDLGLDPNTAAKIKSIKQLRPLSNKQPFGIFFVEFDRKKLPVVAMRRILGKLVSKKRESNNPTEHKTWNQDDLLFISAFGEDQTRRLDFAHFADDAQNGLPTLRVLGWDADDTDRKLGWVERQLRDHLLWPDDATPDEWRIQWRSAFTLRNREVITTSKALAAALAELARKIRARVLAAIALESPKGPLRKLHQAFQDSLIHDLDHSGFADMYAQTIAYGLLSARMSRPAGLVADDAALMIPNTNPFLRELMEEFLRIGGRHKQTPGAVGIDFDELGVNEVVDLLREANIAAVIADFGRERPGEDPVIHFYEYFMEVYDKKQKVSRGVFYTPRPVVSFIVRSVDEILRTEFGLPLGLADTTTWGEMAERFNSSPTPSESGPVGEADAEASASLSRPRRERAGERAPSPTSSPSSASDPRPFTIPDTVKPSDPFVQILDPATGTGTFLVEVIDLIHRRMTGHWEEEGKTKAQIDRLWNEYVPDHLLPRLYGFELMMAPYAIAHMKIGLKLADTGYRFQSEQRLRVFLTNSLEPPTDLGEMLEFVAPFLAHEARAANAVKRTLRASVVIGNPPYAGHSSNKSTADDGTPTHIGQLIQPYFMADGAPLGERNPKWLQDDYVKFVRLAQTHLDSTSVGTMGFITNHGFLGNPTFRGMRQSLLNTFSQLLFLDLRGNSNRNDEAAAATGDENVFDIQQGVAISIMSRLASESGVHPQVRHAEFLGSRNEKGRVLLGQVPASSQLQPASPFYLFIPQNEAAAAEYWSGWNLDAAMPVNSVGIVTGQDSECIAFNMADAVTLATQHGVPLASVVPLLYRPFDLRFVVYHDQVVTRRRDTVMRHLVRGANIGLISARSNKSDRMDHFFVTRTICEAKCGERTTQSAVFPLFRFEGSELRELAPEAMPNFSGPFMARATALCGDAPPPDWLLHYIYAEVFSATYRERYRGQLRIDYPHLLLTTDRVLAGRLVSSGADLVALHLLEDDYPHASWNQPGATTPNPLATPITTFHDAPHGDREVRKVGEGGKAMAESPMGDGLGRVYINDTAYFDGVPEAVWNFHIGGYQVCHKWLSDRKGVAGGKNPHPGRVLTDEDIAHYHRIVIALNETIRLMGEIDEVIEEHGGWPGAFVTE